jgi:HTH-type transcriptional regulator/antitoxin PezA
VIKNYIPENLKYLIALENSSMDEFGVRFELGRGMISQYIRKIAIPKLETIQRICLHFEISMDDFVNKELASVNPYAVKQEQLSQAGETSEAYAISPRYVELLEKSIMDKDKIIKSLEEKLQTDDKSRTA